MRRRKRRREGRGEGRGEEGESHGNSLRAWSLSRNVGVISSGACLGTDHKAASAQPGVPPGPQSGSHSCPSGHRASRAFLPGKPSIPQQRQASQRSSDRAGTAQGPRHPCQHRHPRGTEQRRAPALSSGGGQAPAKELRLVFHSSKVHEPKLVHFTKVTSPAHTRRDAERQCQRPWPCAGLRVSVQGVPEPGTARRAKRARAWRLQKHQLCQVRPGGRSAQKQKGQRSIKGVWGDWLVEPHCIILQTVTATIPISRSNGSPTLSRPSWRRGIQRIYWLSTFGRYSHQEQSVQFIVLNYKSVFNVEYDLISDFFPLCPATSR